MEQLGKKNGRGLATPAGCEKGGDRSRRLSYLSFHHQVWRSEPCPFEEQVEVGPFEHQFGHVVEFRVLEQTHWSDCWKRILSGQWFLVVVKVNYIGFPEA